jgi:ATP-dependent RNA helicase RhlB
VQSQTGTGKTAAFLIVIFQRLLSEDLLAGKKAIIMVPTRELAVQVEEEAKLLGRYLPFKIGSFYGGVGYTQQQILLKDKVQILVGTPGRVLDLNKSGRMNLMDIAFLVLDEADRMFDMGFYPDLRKLIKVVPPADRRQTMLFSATLNAWVKNLAWEYTKSPYEIEIEPETVTVEEVDQVLYHVPSEDKMRLLLGILEREQPESALIFCNTKRYTEIVAKRLRVNGYDCEFIIGDLPQVRRLKVIEDLKAGRIRYLVATDVAARGLDIEGLALVVNYDLPVEAENYVHRIGRTARAGKTGKAITLASEQDVYELPAIEKYIGKKIPSEIANQELQAGDKSEGMRIHTDFYEVRREGRGREGGRSIGSAGGRSREGRPREGRRFHGGERDRDQAGNRGGEDRKRPDGRPSYAAEADRSAGRTGSAGRPGGGRRQAGGQNPGKKPDKDLSGFSFEERMAYYKQKYEDSGVARPGRTPPGGRKTERNPPPPTGQSPASGRRNRGRSKRGRNPEEKRDRETGGRNSGRRSAAEPQNAGREKAQTPKKGIISRILGIFKKE